MSGPVMTSEEVSQFLRICTPTVRRLAVQGKLPGFKVGRQWRFSRAKILAWAEQGSAKDDEVDVRPDSESTETD